MCVESAFNITKIVFALKSQNLSGELSLPAQSYLANSDTIRHVLALRYRRYILSSIRVDIG